MINFGASYRWKPHPRGQFDRTLKNLSVSTSGHVQFVIEMDAEERDNVELVRVGMGSCPITEFERMQEYLLLEEVELGLEVTTEVARAFVDPEPGSVAWVMGKRD